MDAESDALASAPAHERSPTAVSRRRLAGVAALALAGGALSGRVSNRRPGSNRGGTVRSLAGRQRLRVAFTEQHASKLAPMFARFESEHDVTLEVTALPPAGLYALLAVELLHETQSLDVVSLSDDWIPSLGRSAVLATVADLAADDTPSGVHRSVAALGRSQDDDQLVAVPWTIDVGFTAVDGAALGMTTQPRRWSEFAGLVEASGSGRLALAGASGDAAAGTFRAVLRGYGKDIVEPGTNRPTLTDYDARRAMAMMRRLQAQTSVSPLAVDDRGMGNLLTQMTISGCAHVWSSTWLEAGAPPSWTLLPALRASAPRGSRLLRAWLLATPKSSPAADLARTFQAWMLEPGAQRSLLDAGLVPSTRAVLGDATELAHRPAIADIVRSLSSSTARPRLRSFPEINRVCGEAVASVLAGNASAGVAFRGANSEMRRILEREGELHI